MLRLIRLLPFFVLAALILAACNLPSRETAGTPDISVIHTAAAETVIARLTQGAPIFTPTPTSMFQQPTDVVIDVNPTNTQVPQPTQAPTSTPAPTSTSLPTATATASPTPIPCLLATFVKDVSIPDGTDMGPGEDFTKTWRLLNSGSCTWTKDFSVVMVSGDELGATSVPMPEEVLPGETIDISVDLVAPNYAGGYESWWMLKSSSGTRFGVGKAGDVAFWLDIDVKIPATGTVYNFATNFCTAKWESAMGVLDCPGEVNDRDGFVVRLDNPVLESTKVEKPTLWTETDNGFNGWLTGIYPKYKIQTGDHFYTSVGCLANSPKCDVTLVLQIRQGTSLIKLGDWHEVSEGKIQDINIDLSQYAGQEYEFIFTVISNGETTDDAAFWLNPRISR